MTSTNAPSIAKEARDESAPPGEDGKAVSLLSSRLVFWLVLGGVFSVSLLVFTFTIGDGRLSGPGIALALSAGVLVWVARLLFESARALVSTGANTEALEQKAASGRRRKELEREYYNLKRALKELELDYAMSKVSEEDYQEIRTRYRERAVRVLRQLDQGESYRAQIEADLKARRTALEVAPPAAAAEPLPEPTPAPPSSSACPKCETRNDGDAVFCKKCGQRLLAA